MKGEAYRESSLGGGEGRRKKKEAVCMVRREEEGGGAGVEGFSGAVQARSAKICLMHSLNLGPCLKVTGEACAERSRRKKPCSSESACNHGFRSALVLFRRFHFGKMVRFQSPGPRSHACVTGSKVVRRDI